MTRLCLRENPHTETLLKIARHKEVWEDQRNLLEIFARSSTHGIDIKYDYKHRDDNGEGFGRIYPTTYKLSTIYMWNRIRSTLFAKSELDIDIINAQPSILLGYCQILEKMDVMEKGSYDSLIDYVNNRQDKIDEFYINANALDNFNKETQNCYTKKDCFKKLVIMLTFGSTISAWAREFGFNANDYKLTNWIKSFEMELHYISKIVVKTHKKKDIAIDIWKKKHIMKLEEKRGKKLKKSEIQDIEINYKKVLSLLLQDKETEICLNAIEKLQSKGYNVTSYIYDGFQIKNDKELTQDVLDEISNSSFNCKFIVKPFVNPLDLSEEELHPEPPDYFRADLLTSMGWNSTDETTEVQLNSQKEYFEKFFGYVEGAGKIFEKNSGKIYYHSPSTCVSRFSNCFYWKKDNDGKLNKVSFFKYWEQRVDRVSYRSVETLPPPLHCPKNVLNLWDGYPIEKIPLDEDADDSEILKLIKSVCNHDEKVIDYLLNWFAHKVQYPGKKTMVCIIFYSNEEGTGKTSVAEGIMKAFLMDKSNEFLLPTSTIDSITGKFSVAGEQILCVINEANLADTHKVLNPLKTFITDSSFRKEIKGVMSETVPNISELIATTNNANAFKLGQHDRRFQVIEPDSSNVNDPAFFKPIHKALNDVRIMRKFFERLKNRDISDFNASTDRVMTDIQKEFKVNSLSNIQEFFIDLYEDNDFNREELMDTNQLYERYKAHCLVNGKADKIVNNKAFTMKVKKEIQGYATKKQMIDGVRKHFVRIDWLMLGKWVKENTLDNDEEDDYEDSGTEVETDDEI